MREVIATGKTVEEATENACAQLGVTRDEVSIEILEMPVKKLFRTIPAKVKAVCFEQTSVIEETIMTEETLHILEPETVEEQEQPICEVVAPTVVSVQPEIKSEKEEQTISPELQQKVSIAMQYLSDIFEKMGVGETTITPDYQSEAVVLKVEGEKAGTLIGRRGETMEALSYLASLSANRLEGDYLKLGLDVAGYRSKRENDLGVLARRIGTRVLKSGRSQELEPMNPYERRIIHSAISEMEGVHSESRGEGADRRVVIYPDSPAPRSGRRSYRGGKGNFRNGNRRSSGNTQKENGETTVRRTETLNDDEGIALYGKIEI